MTDDVMRDGWYVTGDIASIGEDGFICITDDFKRAIWNAALVGLAVNFSVKANLEFEIARKRVD